MRQVAAQPGQDLVVAVRVGFIQQGTTLTSWCNTHGIRIGNARAALIGLWDGPKGKAMRDRIVRASKTTDYTAVAA